MLRFFGSLISVFLFFAFSGFSQDSTRVLVSDTSSRVKHPVYHSFGIDVSRIFLTALPGSFSGFEGSYDYRKGPFSGQFHLGQVSHSKDLARYTARSNGFYLSSGIAKNFISDKENVVGFGLGLGFSSFRYKASNLLIMPLAGRNGALAELPTSTNFSSWVELFGSVKTKVSGLVMMGFEVRLKARVWNYNDGFPSYFSPGYGLSRNGFNPGFNYYLFIQIRGSKRHGSKAN